MGQPQEPPTPGTPLAPPDRKSQGAHTGSCSHEAPLVIAGEPLVRRWTGGAQSGARPFLTIWPASPFRGVSCEGPSARLSALCTLPLPCS